MNPFVFWMALATTLILSLVLSTMPSRDLAWGGITALCWIATVSLVWTRWVPRPAGWLARLAAGIGLALLAGLVVDWTLRTDVFVVYRRNCPPRAGTVWSLWFVWACGIGLKTFALWGKGFRFADIAAARSLRAAAWWLLAVAWTAACGYVLARNIDAAVAMASLKAAAKVLGIVLGFALVIVLPLTWMSRAQWKARRQATQDFALVDAAARAQVLAMIDRHARKGDYRLVYRAAAAFETGDPVARIGGDPLAAPGEEWPLDDAGQPGTFLLQVPLDGVHHAAWKGRVICVYLMQYELLIRSHTAVAGLATVPAPTNRMEPMALEALAVPVLPPLSEDDTSDEPSDADWLLDHIPGLRERLAEWGAHPALMLSMLLTGFDSGDGYGIDDLLAVGGRPNLIQSEHSATCAVCGNPMRFLLQFGDVTDDSAFGGAGMGYVYGCDAHPAQCEAFTDCY